MLTLPRFFAIAVGLLAVMAVFVLSLAIRVAGGAILRTGCCQRQGSV